MKLYNALAHIAMGVILTVCVFVGWNIVRSPKRVLTKTLSLAVLLLLAIPAWYLLQAVVITVVVIILALDPQTATRLNMNADEFYDHIADLAVFVVVLICVFVGWKIVRCKIRRFAKVFSLAVLLTLAIPAYYLLQGIVITVLARVMPLNPIVNCMDLSESDCKRRPDCQLIYPPISYRTSKCIYN